MAIYKIPAGASLVDGQFIQVSGPEGITTGYHYDSNTKTFYFKESQIIVPSQHGNTHIAEDPVPNATKNLPGLMSPDDKCKLDNMLGMRVGVLGQQGSGFPDDGGWIDGDLILAAGSEFVTLERVGNIIRFTVDSPNPLNCACEECAQIFWIQDETDVASIRTPSCNGKLPGANIYGELKVHVLPESTLVDPSSPSKALNRKTDSPALRFTRYTNSISPGKASIEAILERRFTGVTKTGWVMTPGPLGIPECIWYMGDDEDGNEVKFELSTNSKPGLLGALLYKGHTLTRQMGVVTGYTSTVLSTNLYKIQNWSVQNSEPVGDEFEAFNVWHYENPGNSKTTLVDPQALTLDATVDLLPVGTLVQLWGFEVSANCMRWYFNSRPAFNPNNAWAHTGSIEFGNLHEERSEVTGPGPTELTASTLNVSDSRLFERSVWGITGFEDSLLLSDDGVEIVTGSENTAVFTDEPSGESLNNEYLADVDPSLPGLRVYETDPSTYAERPVYIWNRQNRRNFYAKFLVGRPDASVYPPYDILLRAPIDSIDDTYIKVIKRDVYITGPFAGLNYVVVKGAHWRQLPEKGVLRILTGSWKNRIWKYNYKINFSTWDDDAVELVGDVDMFPFEDDLASTGTFADEPSVTTIASLLHADFTAPCLRVEFSVNQTIGQEVAQVQFKVGLLDMSTVYELEDEVTPQTVGDNLVRGLLPGFAVSELHTQVGFLTTGTEQVQAEPDGFILYEGGFVPQAVNGETELWNELEVMVRDGQCWVWWNQLLVPPSTTDSANLESPVAISTPYFPLPSVSTVGKVGMRLWPGAMLRQIGVWDQVIGFSEFKYGQLEIGDTGTGTS